MKDLSESIVEPSKVISDQYKASVVTTNSGKIYTGRIVSEAKEKLIIVTDAEDSTKVVEVKKSALMIPQRAVQDLQGGTFTITNPGPFGSIMSVPIINKGQAGILAFDAVAKRPVVVTDDDGNDAVAIRHMVFLSMSWDHRIIDGAEAARYLSQLKSQLEQADFAPDLSAYLPGR